MAREILYKKLSVSNEKQPELKTQNVNLIEWLSSHRLINISGLCKQVGINRSNFDKYCKMKSIPLKYESKIINILKHYGYGK